MTKSLYAIIILLLVIIFASCTDDEAYKALIPDDDIQELWTFPKVVIAGINRDVSRIGYEDNNTSGVKQTWEGTDVKFILYNTKAENVTYNLDSIYESDNSKATFKLYGDTPLIGAEFTAMVWIDAEGHQITVTAGDSGLIFDLDMTGQTQSADDELGHLENYDLITAHITSEDQLDNINFTSQGSLLTFDITNIPSYLGTPDSLYFLAMGPSDNTFKTNYNLSSPDTILCAMALSGYDNPTSIKAYMMVPPFSIAERFQLAVILKNSTSSVSVGYAGEYTTTKDFQGAVRYNFPVDSLIRFDIYTIPMDGLNEYWDENGWIDKYKPAGTGTESDPYLLSTAWELAWLKAMTIYDKVSSNNTDKGQYNIPSKYFKLNTNIFCTPDLNWKPIGGSATTFSANFDGGGNFIYGMNITKQGSGHFGFFSDTDGANISNLTIKGTITEAAGAYMGGFIGYAYDTTISKCNNYVKIDANTSFGGGMIGVGAGNLIIEDCTNNADINMTLYVGGIIGSYQLLSDTTDNKIPTAKIYNCTNNNAISGTQQGVGGIAGECMLKVPISNCTNNGAISRSGDNASAYIGGIIGNGWAYRIFDCKNTGTITGPSDFTGCMLGANYGSGGNLGLGNTNTGSVNGVPAGDSSLQWLGTTTTGDP